MHARNESLKLLKVVVYANASALYINANAYRFLVSPMTNHFLSFISFIYSFNLNIELFYYYSHNSTGLEFNINDRISESFI